MSSWNHYTVRRRSPNHTVMQNRSQGREEEQPTTSDTGRHPFFRVGVAFAVCWAVLVAFFFIHKAYTWLGNRRRARKRHRSRSDSLEGVTIHRTSTPKPRRRKGYDISSPSHAREFAFEEVTGTPHQDYRQIYRPQPAPSAGQLHREPTGWSSPGDATARSQPGPWESTQEGQMVLVNVDVHRSANSPPGSVGTIHHQRPASSASPSDSHPIAIPYFSAPSSPIVSDGSPWNRQTQSGRSQENLSANLQQPELQLPDSSLELNLEPPEEFISLEKVGNTWRYLNTSPPP